MSYNTLIDSQLIKAFRLLKDLAKDAVLTRKTVGAFDFATGQASVTSSPTVGLKVIPTSKEKYSRDRKTVSMDIMMKSKDVGGDISAFSTIAVDGVTWKFGSPLKDSGFILVTTVFREVAVG